MIKQSWNSKLELYSTEGKFNEIYNNTNQKLLISNRKSYDMNWKELFEILERLICYTYGTIDCFNGLGETINFPAKKDNTIFVYDNIV